MTFSTDVLLDELKTTISRDLCDALCGELLGAGCSRQVFLCRLDPSLVIKVERQAGSFQNAIENEVWGQVCFDKKTARWLAPIKFISACGTVMVQERTWPASRQAYPAKIPAFLTDTKRPNWGMLKNRIVCHDYGVLRLVNVNQPMRLVKAEWWDE